MDYCLWGYIMQGKFTDLTGSKFGRWTVIRYEGINKLHRSMWMCRCECGTEKVIAGYSLTRGGTKSCGCLAKELVIDRNKKRFTHKMSKSRLYEIWALIKQRCYNKKNKDYKSYGGRGIAMCDEWKKDFISFFDWSMANGYNPKLTIDRVNNNGNYSPDNCRWATLQEQANNKRVNRLISYKNEIHTIAEWARQVNIKERIIRSRLSMGWSFEKACEKPVGKYVRKNSQKSTAIFEL